MKEMVTKVPLGACPNCGHKQFVVLETSANIYLTNQDGEVIDAKFEESTACGKCCKCGNVYDMISLSDKFIPMTPLRRILFEYSPHALSVKDYCDYSNHNIPNPMEEHK